MKDRAGNEWLCPLDALKNVKEATQEELDDCVEPDVVLAILEISRLNDNLNLGDLLKEPVGQVVKLAGFTHPLTQDFPINFSSLRVMGPSSVTASRKL